DPGETPAGTTLTPTSRARCVGDEPRNARRSDAHSDWRAQIRSRLRFRLTAKRRIRSKGSTRGAELQRVGRAGCGQDQRETAEIQRETAEIRGMGRLRLGIRNPASATAHDLYR